MTKSTTLLLGVALLGAVPAAVHATAIPLAPFFPDVPAWVADPVSQDTMTAIAYRAVIDETQSRVEQAQSGLTLTPAQNPTASIGGTIDLKYQTYTWYSDNYGNPLTTPVVEDWLRIVATDLSFSDPDLAFSLPSSRYQIYHGGDFSYGNSGCPEYPDRPWAQGYHESCMIFSVYSESLQGTLAGLDLTISGRWGNWFSDSTSYDLVATLQLQEGQTTQAPVPDTAALVLLGLGGVALQRRRQRHSNAAE